MVWRYLSLLAEPTPGFEAAVVKKRDLLAGPVVLLLAEPDQLTDIVPDYRDRMRGVLVSFAGEVGTARVGPMLWHLQVLPGSLPLLQTLAAPLLEAVQLADDYHEQGIRTHRTLERVSQDLAINRQDYQRVTAKLEEKVRRLEHTEQLLRDVNERLELRIDERTAALATANEQLTLTVHQLQIAKDEIVRSEKLAALGAIVAGMSHELNTPIGNGLLSASALQEAAHKLQQAMQEGLKRSQLLGFLDDTMAHCDLLLRNLNKANDLITGFKQVAVDQTSSRRRYFELGPMLDDVLMTLLPAWRKTPHQMSVQIEAGLTMDSYPGPLGQVVSNLVQNALLHAFDPAVPGHLTIRAHALGEERLQLQVQDDGAGIAPEHLGRVFDPFFTTRMGQGGSGLGLNIVHGLVCNTLGGSIEVSSQPGQGSCFTLVLPRVAPG